MEQYSSLYSIKLCSVVFSHRIKRFQSSQTLKSVSLYISSPLTGLPYVGSLINISSLLFPIIPKPSPLLRPDYDTHSSVMSLLLFKFPQHIPRPCDIHLRNPSTPLHIPLPRFQFTAMSTISNSDGHSVPHMTRTQQDPRAPTLHKATVVRIRQVNAGIRTVRLDLNPGEQVRTCSTEET